MVKCNSSIQQWLVGLVAWFSLWVREVLGSTPGQAHIFLLLLSKVTSLTDSLKIFYYLIEYIQYVGSWITDNTFVEHVIMHGHVISFLKVCSKAINMLDIDQILASGCCHLYYTFSIKWLCVFTGFSFPLAPVLKSCELLFKIVLLTMSACLRCTVRELDQLSQDDMIATAVGKWPSS